MLSNLEAKLKEKAKQSYLELPLGVRRLWIATSVIWLAAYLILNWNDLSLLWKGATTGPNSTCAQVYGNDEQRRSACEINWTGGPPISKPYEAGSSEPFGVYFEKHRRDDKLFIWLATPIIWLGALWAFMWVRRGFAADSAK